jgi:hypothetical protein
MHQYGAEGLCLVWGINNALQEKILSPSKLMPYIDEENKRDKDHNSRYYVGRDGINFRVFKKIIDKVFKITLKRVKSVRKHGSYIVTYDFGDYYHTIGVYEGNALDSRKQEEITEIKPPGLRIVDIYKVSRR